MLDCGIDESGDKKSPKGELLVVSAQIGSTAHLKKLSKAWQSDLDAYGIPYFHAKEFWNRRVKIYKHLSNTKRKQLLTSLVSHIGKYVDWGITTYLYVDNYNRQTSPRFRSQWGAAYTFSIEMLFLALRAKLQDADRVGEVVNVLVEEGHANQKQALGAIKPSKLSNPIITIGNYGFGTKINNPILQAADALAFASCQHLRDGHSSIFDKLRATGRTKYTLMNCNDKVIEHANSSVAEYFEKRKTGLVEPIPER